MKKRKSIKITYVLNPRDKPQLVPEKRGATKGMVLRIAQPFEKSTPRGVTNQGYFVFGAGKNEEGWRGSISKTWAVYKNSPLAPLFMDDAVRLASVSGHFEEIEALIGASLSSAQRDAIQLLSNKNLLETISVSISGPWEVFERDLQKMVKIGNDFITWFDPPHKRRQRAGQLPTEHAVMAHFRSGPDADQYNAAIEGVHLIIDKCNLALREISSRKRRGAKSDVCVARICELAISISTKIGMGLKLPSNGDRDGGKVFSRTALFSLARYLVALTHGAGLWTVENSRLNSSQKAAAMKAVRVTFSKTDGALLDHLRKALKQRPVAR